MKLLLDTHAFLWFVEGTEDVSAAALHAVLDDANLLFLSPASYWEICVKLSIGKLVLADGWPRLFDPEIRRNGIRWLDVKPEHVRGIIDLPFHHRDLFDRLLVGGPRSGARATGASGRAGLLSPSGARPSLSPGWGPGCL